MRVLSGVVALVGAQHADSPAEAAQHAQHVAELKTVCHDLVAHSGEFEQRCTSYWGKAGYQCAFFAEAARERLPTMTKDHFCADMESALRCADSVAGLYTSEPVVALLKANCLEQMAQPLAFCDDLVKIAQTPHVPQLRDSLELCYSTLHPEAQAEVQAVLPTAAHAGAQGDVDVPFDEDDLAVHPWAWAGQLGVLLLAGAVLTGLGVLYVKKRPRMVSLEPFLNTSV